MLISYSSIEVCSKHCQFVILKAMLESAQINFDLVLLTLVVLFLVLFLWQFYKNYQASKNSTRFIEENRLKGYELLHDAVKRAQEIISTAELESVKVTAQNTLKFDAATSQITDAMVKSHQNFKTYLDSLSQQASQSASSSDNLIRQRMNSLFEEFEQHLSDFLTQTQQQSSKAIALEIQSSRNLIETYKQQQFSLIDENIVAMLERTLSLVLVKKLSLKDQVDLVYESLEKAKAEKFIV